MVRRRWAWGLVAWCLSVVLVLQVTDPATATLVVGAIGLALAWRLGSARERTCPNCGNAVSGGMVACGCGYRFGDNATGGTPGICPLCGTKVPPWSGQCHCGLADWTALSADDSKFRAASVPLRGGHPSAARPLGR